MIKPGRGVIAICSRGYIGLITEDEPKEVHYPDGNTGVAWVGIQLTDKPPFTPDYTGPRVLVPMVESDTKVSVLRRLSRYCGEHPCSIETGRIQDLPEEERIPFVAWLQEQGAIRPYLEGDSLDSKLDGYFKKHYLIWKQQKEKSNA